MNGKVLKIASNDLYGNADERFVRVYVCFQHNMYMNNYAVFSIDGNDKLCFGSIHLKDKSLVIFSVKKDVKKYISEFLSEYIDDKIENFGIIDIKNIEKVELVSYSEMEYDKINLLEDKSISKITDDMEEVKEGKPVFMYILIIILMLVASGITLLYFKPDLFTIKYKVLECNDNLYDYNIKLYYDINKEIKFNDKDIVEKISVIKTYTFLDTNSYYTFKDNNEELNYFNNGEGYKYIDEELKLKILYDEDSIIDNYDEMLVYMNKEGYNCVVHEYEE